MGARPPIVPQLSTAPTPPRTTRPRKHRRQLLVLLPIIFNLREHPKSPCNLLRRHPLLFVFIVLVKDLQMIAELQVHALGDLFRVLVQLCHHVEDTFFNGHSRLPQALSVHRCMCCSFFLVSFSLLLTDLGLQSPTLDYGPPNRPKKIPDIAKTINKFVSYSVPPLSPHLTVKNVVKNIPMALIAVST